MIPRHGKCTAGGGDDEMDWSYFIFFNLTCVYVRGVSCGDPERQGVKSWMRTGPQPQGGGDPQGGGGQHKGQGDHHQDRGDHHHKHELWCPIPPRT